MNIRLLIKTLTDTLWHGYDLDGGDIQELLEKCGVIKPASYDPSKHGEIVGDDTRPGKDIFILTDEAKRL